MNNNLYREDILEHWKNPLNYGELVDADFIIDENNPLCGDNIHLTGKVSGGKLIDVKFKGEGCVISKAASSILTEFVKDKKIEEIKNLKPEIILKLLRIQLSLSRIKCSLLPYSALERGLKKIYQPKDNE